MGSERFRISPHESGCYCVSIPKYKGGEVVSAKAHDALARVTLAWIEKCQELSHRIYHPNDARDFRDCSEEECRETTRVVVELRAALHPQPQETK